ncbi:Lipoprotein prgK precursor [Ewingella americana]|uniref:Lipoprotein n=1 Tax=Ewingella americana TaxID=41202 RepID=A0A377N974_9GAMM|nr:Lipoprotein prgK precursor [Ewingella americana]
MTMVKIALKIFSTLLIVLALAGCEQRVVLNTGLTENDANDIIAELSRYKISADKQIDKTGVTVLVDQDTIERSVQILNAAGLPHKARTNLGEVFQKSGIISSPLEERARYIFALSQEVESTLAQIDGVVVARVNVVLPERVAPASLSNPPRLQYLLSTSRTSTRTASSRKFVVWFLPVFRGWRAKITARCLSCLFRPRSTKITLKWSTLGLSN